MQKVEQLSPLSLPHKHEWSQIFQIAQLSFPQSEWIYNYIFPWALDLLHLGQGKGDSNSR